MVHLYGIIPFKIVSILCKVSVFFWGSSKNLLKDGKFVESDLELKYAEYCVRKAKDGKVPKDRLNWKEASDYWTKDSPMARGNKFNKTAEKIDGIQIMRSI